MSEPGLKLPVQVESCKAEGFATPKQDKAPQHAYFLPKRVLPIIFLPGVMGSNLVIANAERMKQLDRNKEEDNKAWRPDDLGAFNVTGNANSSARDRQLRLDPSTTVVDVYKPADGKPELDGDKRNKSVDLDWGFHTPTLMDDPPTAKDRRTAEQKARARGWGEVHFASYGKMLQRFESRLNNTFANGKLRNEWSDVIGVDPVKWQADPSLPQKALTEDELKKVATGCWFPVHALGYNWLQSNAQSAKAIAKRIQQIMDDYTKYGYECPQVVVVTHSMGGLVARALIHPEIGGFQDKVLGMVHSVMPAIGSPMAYRRIRAGFEDPGMMNAPVDSMSAKVAGNYGDEVTAVLANAPGGLQLLPTETYGNGWMKVIHNGHKLESWPKAGDPYTEIYKVRGKWYSLFREEWINPAKINGPSFTNTSDYLDQAQEFHQQIRDTYHPNSYGHYGADPAHPSFGEVVWAISKNCKDPSGWQSWSILKDNRQGTIDLMQWHPNQPNTAFNSRVGATVPEPIHATIQPPSAPGDATVPVQSADHQLKSGKFAGIFRQVGYGHQDSYKSEHVLASTLYCIVRLANKATWACK
jgi:pimeloyl-ACP methyl ester carboxylesterase